MYMYYVHIYLLLENDEIVLNNILQNNRNLWSIHIWHLITLWTCIHVFRDTSIHLWIRDNAINLSAIKKIITGVKQRNKHLSIFVSKLLKFFLMPVFFISSNISVVQKFRVRLARLVKCLKKFFVTLPLNRERMKWRGFTINYKKYCTTNWMRD